MRIDEAVQIVCKQVLPKLSGREAIALGVMADFAKTMLRCKTSVREMHAVMFGHINQRSLFGEPGDGQE